MFTLTSSSFEDDFPPLQFTSPSDQIRHEHKIAPPSVISSDRTKKSISIAEATLNWQFTNVLAQNLYLQQIAQTRASFDKKVSSLEQLIYDLQQQIQSLHQELLHMSQSTSIYSSAFAQKEAEMKHLKI